MSSSQIVVFNPGYMPVVYDLQGHTLYPGEQVTVEPDSRTLSQINKGRLLDITNQPTSAAAKTTAGKASSGEDA